MTTTDPIADALMARFKQLAEVIDRLAALDERPPVPSIAELRDPAAAERTASDLVLKAYRVAADPANYALLVDIAATTETVGVIRRRRGWPLIDTEDRVQELMRSGLITYDMERDRAQPTQAGAAIVQSLRAEVTALTRRIGEWLAGRVEAR